MRPPALCRPSPAPDNPPTVDGCPFFRETAESAAPWLRSIGLPQRSWHKWRRETRPARPITGREWAHPTAATESFYPQPCLEAASPARCAPDVLEAARSRSGVVLFQKLQRSVRGGRSTSRQIAKR